MTPALSLRFFLQTINTQIEEVVFEEDWKARWRRWGNVFGNVMENANFQPPSVV